MDERPKRIKKFAFTIVCVYNRLRVDGASLCHLADCVKKLHRRACRTIVFPHSTNHIIYLCCRRHCCSRRFINSLIWILSKDDANEEECRLKMQSFLGYPKQNAYNYPWPRMSGQEEEGKN